MKTQKVLPAIICTCIASAIGGPACIYTGNTKPAKSSRPNIIFILADDLGYGDIGCYNSQSKVPTPNVDRLAAQGMRFTNAHSPSTVCTPSRYGLLTGQMPFRINVRGVFDGVGGPCLIKENQLTLPQMLRKQGYATAMTGKWHVGLSFPDKDGQRIIKGGLEGVKMIDYSHAIPDAPIHRGFDRFFGTSCCPGTDLLYAFIEGDRIPVSPTGMLDKTNLPKHPYSVDNDNGMIVPGYDLEELDMIFLKKSQEFLEEHVQKHPDKPFFLLHSTAAVHLPSFPAPRFKGTTKAGPHGDFIFEFDYVVGELMKTLEKLGVANNTVVMISSDNGPETIAVVYMRADYGHDGARPWRGMKRDNWEGGHRVPFIVHWPGKVSPGSISDQATCLTDIMATCADIAGAKLPDNSAEDSFSILPVLLGKDNGKPVRPYTLHQNDYLALGIRKGMWKYLDHKGSGGNNYDKNEWVVDLRPFALPEAAPDAPGQLYDLDKDPGETTNLYFEHPEIVRELKALLENSKTIGRSRPVQSQKNNFRGIQHFGIPVADQDQSVLFHTRLGFDRVLSAQVPEPGGAIHVVMMKRDNVIVELYQLTGKELDELHSRSDGHIDHIAFDGEDIDKAFGELKTDGFDTIEDEPVFLDFWDKGWKYFAIRGPNVEKLEFNQIL